MKEGEEWNISDVLFDLNNLLIRKCKGFIVATSSSFFFASLNALYILFFLDESYFYSLEYTCAREADYNEKKNHVYM